MRPRDLIVRHARPLVVVLLVGMTLAVFGRTWRFGFVYDDHFYVDGTPRVAAGLSLDNLRWAFATTELANWHPLTWLSWMLDAELYGAGPAGFHLTNVLLHTANVLLLLAVLRQMTGAFWRSAFVAALFAVHPLHVESVAWVAERKDVLSTLFGLLAVGAHVRYAARRGVTWYALSLCAFAASLCAKQMLVTLPFLLLLLDFWPVARSAQPLARRALEKAPFFALSAAASALALVAQARGGALSMLPDVSPLARCMNAVLVYVLYLVKAAWPAGLAVLYPHPGEAVPRVAAAAAGLALALISAAAFAQRRRRPYLLVGWLWYLGTLVPVIGVVQVGVQQMADRYTYWPLTGIFVTATWGVPALAPKGPWRRVGLPALAAIVLAALALAAWRQTGFWRDDVTLFARAVRVTENNALAHHNLGVALFERGRLAEAVLELQAALRIDPAYASAHYNLGNALLALQREAEALDHYREALRLAPGDARAHANLGISLVRMGRVEEGLAQYEAALRIAPEDAAILANAGNALMRLGRRAEAIERYRAAVRARPGFALAHLYLGNALFEERRYAEALTHYEAACAADPGLMEARQQRDLARRRLAPP